MFFIPHQSWAKYPQSYPLKDFDRGLLKKYTVKVLDIMHACSPGSTKFSSIWILDYLWKISFLFHVKVGWNILQLFLSSLTLKFGCISSWYFQYITGNNYCKSIVIFTGLTVWLQVCSTVTTSSFSGQCHYDYRKCSYICALENNVRLIWPSKCEQRLAWPE